MSFIIPVPSNYSSRSQVTLDDTPFGLLLTWNERTSGWTLGLEDRDGQPIILGRRIVLQLDIFSGYRYLPGMPTGAMVALDPLGAAKKIEREDLTTGKIQLQYFTRAELDAL